MLNRRPGSYCAVCPKKEGEATFKTTYTMARVVWSVAYGGLSGIGYNRNDMHGRKMGINALILITQLDEE